jgi:hypothetical protein
MPDKFLLYVGGGGCSGNRSNDSEFGYDAPAMTELGPASRPNIHTGLYFAV